MCVVRLLACSGSHCNRQCRSRFRGLIRRLEATSHVTYICTLGRERYCATSVVFTAGTIIRRHRAYILVNPLPTLNIYAGSCFPGHVYVLNRVTSFTVSGSATTRGGCAHAASRVLPFRQMSTCTAHDANVAQTGGYKARQRFSCITTQPPIRTACAAQAPLGGTNFTVTGLEDAQQGRTAPEIPGWGCACAYMFRNTSPYHVRLRRVPAPCEQKQYHGEQTCYTGQQLPFLPAQLPLLLGNS